MNCYKNGENMGGETNVIASAGKCIHRENSGCIVPMNSGVNGYNLSNECINSYR